MKENEKLAIDKWSEMKQPDCVYYLHGSDGVSTPMSLELLMRVMRTARRNAHEERPLTLFPVPVIA